MKSIGDDINDKTMQKKHTQVLLAILEHLDANIYISRFHTNEILFINEKMREEYGLTQDVVGQKCWEVLQSGLSEACAFCPDRQLIAGANKTIIWEEESLKTDKYYRNTDSIIEWLDGSMVHLQHSVDVTEEKKINQYLLETKTAVEEAYRTKSDFLSRMSHEIRTPINAIVGMAGVAKNTEDIKKIRLCLDKIEESSNELLGLVNDILDISKFDTQEMVMKSEPFSMEALLVDISQEASPKALEKSQSLHITIDPEMHLHYTGDRQRLMQVIMNLLENAIKFTPQGGKIRLDMREKSQVGDVSEIEVMVKDNGIGIPQEYQKHVFTRFEQYDGSHTRKFSGTGLGLSLCKNIVKLMGGSIGVSSVENEGSAFLFTIMLTRLVDEASSKATNPNVYEHNCPEAIKEAAMKEESQSHLVQDTTEYVNIDEALGRVMGNKNLLKTLYKSYIANNYMDQLRNEVASHDTVAAAQTAHTIKGVSANLSLTKVNETIILLEAQLKSDFSYENTYTDLEIVMNNTLAALVEIIETL